MDWLLQQHRRGGRQRNLWHTLGTIVDDPAFARSIFLWERKIELKELPSLNEADAMLAVLNHDQLFVRFAAARLLESCSGNPTDYNPALGPQIRIRTARAWRSHILSIIERRP